MWPSSKYSRRYQRRLTQWREKQGWVAPPAAVATHDQVSGLNGYSNTEPIDQWETVTPMDADPGYPTTTAYGKPVHDFYEEDDRVPHQYAQGPGDWEFVDQHRQPQYHPQHREYPAVDGPDAQPGYYPPHTTGAVADGRAPSRYNSYNAQTYTSQPVPPPGHPEQPPMTYHPAGERIDPQVGWQQHASWRGTCTPQDVAGFRAPDSPGGSLASPVSDRRRVRQENILPGNAY